MKKSTMEFFALFIGVRKFIIMTLFIAIMCLFRVLDLIDGPHFADNLQVAIVAFFSANFGEHSLDLIKTLTQRKVKNEEKVIKS